MACRSCGLVTDTVKCVCLKQFKVGQDILAAICVFKLHFKIDFATENFEFFVTLEIRKVNDAQTRLDLQ